MTTIAYHHKDKQIAVDGRKTLDGIILTDNSNKTIKNELGLWVLCGAPCDYAALSKLNHNEKCDTNPDCQALLINSDKVFRVFVSGGICFYDEFKHDFALGSGQDFAISLMDHGKSAKEAVEYAMTRDVYTGGKVQVIDVETGKVIS